MRMALRAHAATLIRRAFGQITDAAQDNTGAGRPNVSCIQHDCRATVVIRLWEEQDIPFP
jgi:hypothetical protein